MKAIFLPIHAQERLLPCRADSKVLQMTRRATGHRPEEGVLFPRRPGRRQPAGRSTRLAVFFFWCWIFLAPAADAGIPAAGPAAGLSVTADLKGIVVNDRGEELVVDSHSITAGGVLEYRVVYMNTGDHTLRNLQAALPLPPGTTYYDQGLPAHRRLAAIGATAETADHGETLIETDNAPPMVISGHGERQTIVWQIRALEPGQSASLSVRLRLLVPERALLQPDEDAIGDGLVITTTL